MIDETKDTEKENSRLLAIMSSAIEIEFDTFCDALKLGGKLIFANKYQKGENGPYFHLLEYKGTQYITSTSHSIEKFLV